MWNKFVYQEIILQILVFSFCFPFSSVQLLSRVWFFATPWTAACQASLSITNSRSLFKLMSIESVIPSDYLILCHPLLPPSIFPSIRVFSNESVLCIRWPEYWSFSFSISTSNEYSGLISFRMDWLYLLAVQGTLKGLLQHHSSEASILRHSAFFLVQLSHPYMTTGETIALTRQAFVRKGWGWYLTNSRALDWDSSGASLRSKGVWWWSMVCCRKRTVHVVLSWGFGVELVIVGVMKGLATCKSFLQPKCICGINVFLSFVRRDDCF